MRPTDSNAVFDAGTALLNLAIINTGDIGGLAAVWFLAGSANGSDSAVNARMYRFLNPAVGRFGDLTSLTRTPSGRRCPGSCIIRSAQAVWAPP